MAARTWFHRTPLESLLVMTSPFPFPLKTKHVFEMTFPPGHTSKFDSHNNPTRPSRLDLHNFPEWQCHPPVTNVADPSAPT